ncbi:nucleoside phosphorylase [Furfurilactobacillus siliginis]|nr:nucleoside phosphorylase [Furfurilactobacillus siliginis]GEK29013.1 phosphorylase [Furfurilactobacillus siliginis]
MPIPLFNYDENQTSVVTPTEDPEYQGCSKCLFPFVSETDLEPLLAKYHAHKVYEFETITKVTPIWEITVAGQNMTVAQAPLGAPAAVQILDYLIAHGAKQIVSMGSCGVLTEHAENGFLIPTVALRDEGTSYHYLPAAETIQLNVKMQLQIRTALNSAGYETAAVKTWTTDGFFRETTGLIEKYRAQGYETVEMECAAIAACAAFRNVDLGQFFFTADSLADTASYDKRNWGMGARSTAVQLGVAILRELPA